ncbi:MAG: SUMF1/EgtB/PvdO family nonheme iron enzyme [Pirellulales bacterium]
MLYKTATLVLLLVCLCTRAAAVTIDTVPIGDPGNPADTSYYPQGIGAVGYEYRMSTYEVTVAQYVEFLNAKAASDPMRLFSSEAPIDRSGADGSFSYAAEPNAGNLPITYLNFWSAARFANWMHNGQGNGDTETGSYNLGGVRLPDDSARARTPNADWVVPTEDEFVKAGYYDPRTEAEVGPPGDDHYWLYPTRSDSAPTQATIDSNRVIANPGFNAANWQTFQLSIIGSAGPDSTSYYGTYDQGGNVKEWALPSFGQIAQTKGGSAGFEVELLQAAARFPMFGLAESNWPDAGFRLAFIPEPSSLTLAAMGLAVASAIAYRRGARFHNRG